MPLDIDVMENVVIRRWIETGLAQGRQEGRHDGQKSLLRRQIVSKFGTLPKAFAVRIENASDDELERWSIALLTASNLEGMFAA